MRFPSSLLALSALLAGPPLLLPASAQQTPPAVQPAVQAETAPQAGLSAKEKALLEKIRALKTPRWRSFGSCRYDWTGWRLAADGVRTTSVQCGQSSSTETVAVHCETLKLSYRVSDQPWSSWRLPFTGQESSTRSGEDLMVASLCANAAPIPKPGPATAKPAAQPRKPPAAGGASPRPQPSE